MSETWDYQLRLVIADDVAPAVRAGSTEGSLKALFDVLSRHDAVVKCQYDAFADFVEAMEHDGETDTALYKWTKDTIANPLKQEKYLKSFTIYISGDEVYAKDKADALEAELQPFVGGDIVVSMAKHDTNPANNPQAPAKYRS